MFVHPEDDYDFVVKFQPAVLPRYFQNVSADSSVWEKVGTSENSPPTDGWAPLRPGFDPAEAYLDDLTVRKECPLFPSRLLIKRAAHLRRYS
jgi:U3 small nucleolar RNA-associated protein 22